MPLLRSLSRSPTNASRLFLVAVVVWSFSPQLDAAIRTWDGGGADNNWMSVTNWAGDVAPVAGDDLVFPLGAVRLSNFNNYPSNSAFNSITFTGTNYILSGALILLSAGVTNNSPPLGANTVALPLRLAVNQVFNSSNATTLTLSGAIDSNGMLLTLVGSGGLFLNGVISGTGSLLKTGVGGVVISGSNTFSGSVSVSLGTVTLLNGSALGATIGGTTVSAAAVLRVQNGITVNEAGTSIFGTLSSLIGTNLWTGTLGVVSSASTFDVASGSELNFSGDLAGPGTLNKIGSGTLILSGTTTNTYTGATKLNTGTLRLAKSPGVNAVPAELIVGDHLGGFLADILILDAADQIADGAPITVNSSGYFNLNNQNETVGPLTLNGGFINSNGGLLTLASNVAATNQTGTIQGKLSLGGSTRTLNVPAGASVPMLSIPANITDGGSSAGLTKEGAGELWLTSSNGFSGVTTINGGTLRIFNSFGLGSTNGASLVSSNATLALQTGVSVADEALTLHSGGALHGSGSNTWAGEVTMAGTATLSCEIITDGLNLRGPLSGPGGVVIRRTGKVNFAGTAANTYAGTTLVSEGTLALNKPAGVSAIPQALEVGTDIGLFAGIVQLGANDQIADTTAVTIRDFGTLDLNSFTDLIGSLAGSGAVTLGSGVLTAGSDNSSTLYAGQISGTGSLSKSGTGTLTLSGFNTQSGVTTVNNGTLLVNGSQTNGNISINQGTLGGTGMVGIVFGPVSGFPKSLSPGQSPGVLTATGLLLETNMTFAVELNGLAPGAGYDQLNILGGAVLSGGALNVALGFSPPAGSGFVIINNDGSDPIIGSFPGLTNGATIALGGLPFQISYAAGDGNDVELRRTIAPPSTLTSVNLTNGSSLVLGLGSPGLMYVLEANTNLNSTLGWTPISTNTADGAGLYDFVDADAPLFSMRFYRARSP